MYSGYPQKNLDNRFRINYTATKLHEIELPSGRDREAVIIHATPAELLIK